MKHLLSLALIPALLFGCIAPGVPDWDRLGNQVETVAQDVRLISDLSIAENYRTELLELAAYLETAGPILATPAGAEALELAQKTLTKLIALERLPGAGGRGAEPHRRGDLMELTKIAGRAPFGGMTITTAAERWKPIPGYRGAYEVSDRGQVRSLDREVTQGGRWGLYRRRFQGGTMKMTLNKKGYLDVSLCVGGVQRTFLVHHLVLDSFIGKRPPGTQCRHLDGNPGNNRLENLCWGSPAQNQADRLRHGTDLRGEKATCAKLTERDVREIRELVSSGKTQRLIAEEFGVTESNIRAVATKRTWRHVS